MTRDNTVITIILLAAMALVARAVYVAFFMPLP